MSDLEDVELERLKLRNDGDYPWCRHKTCLYRAGHCQHGAPSTTPNRMRGHGDAHTTKQSTWTGDGIRRSDG